MTEPKMKSRSEALSRADKRVIHHYADNRHLLSRSYLNPGRKGGGKTGWAGKFRQANETGENGESAHRLNKTKQQVTLLCGVVTQQFTRRSPILRQTVSLGAGDRRPFLNRIYNLQMSSSRS